MMALRLTGCALVSMVVVIICLAGTDGQLLNLVKKWDYTVPINMLSPVVINESLVVIASGETSVVGLDITSGEKIFTYDAKTYIAFPPVFHRKFIYLSTGIGARSLLLVNGVIGDIFKVGEPQVIVIDRKGKEIGKYRLPKDEFLNRPPLPCNNCLILATTRSVHVINLTGRRITVLQRKGWSVLDVEVSADYDRVLVGWGKDSSYGYSKRELWCYDVRRGQIAWQQPSKEHQKIEPVEVKVSKERVYINDDFRRIYIADIKTGKAKLLWESSEGRIVIEGVSGESVFVSEQFRKGSLNLLSIGIDGRVTWQFRVDEFFDLYPGKQQVYVVPIPQQYPRCITVNSIGLTDGRLLWKYTFEEVVQVFPPVEFDGKVCLASPAGAVILKSNSGELLWRSKERILAPVAYEHPYLVLQTSDRCLALELIQREIE